jgi:hypothetical protein
MSEKLPEVSGAEKPAIRQQLKVSYLLILRVGGRFGRGRR